jgi:cyclic 2,3-diphosphoglycerate synthetase
VRALFLIDGEHYPPVVLDAMRSVRDSLGAEGVAAAFLGGTEKLKEGTDYGLPLVADRDPVSAVGKALSEHDVDVVVDLSDEPVIGYRERMRIASLVLRAGARYVGSDFEFRPPELRAVSIKPSLAVWSRWGAGDRRTPRSSRDTRWRSGATTCLRPSDVGRTPRATITRRRP